VSTVSLSTVSKLSLIRYSGKWQSDYRDKIAQNLHSPYICMFDRIEIERAGRMREIRDLRDEKQDVFADELNRAL
jgi:hypothetical protein